jgi:hypothetical protein
LGLVVWKSLELRLAEHGLGNSPRKVLEQFAKWKSMDVLLPTDTGHQLHLRLVSQPDQALDILLLEMSLKRRNDFALTLIVSTIKTAKCSGNFRLKNEPKPCPAT